MEKNSCTPINPKRYSFYGLKKIHTRNLPTKKNSGGSKIPLPPSPPITFLMVRSLTILNRVDGYRARGVLTNVLRWEAQPRDPTPYPFIYQFWPKRYPFCIPSVDKWYPFHIPGLELCIPDCCKCTVFEIWIHHKTRTFSRLFYSQKMHLLAF